MLNYRGYKDRFPSEPLAIVGMACRLPGADNLESFWNLIAAGESGIQEMPEDRMDRRLYLSSRQGEQSKSYSSISGLIPPRPNDPSSDFRTINHDQLNWDPCHEILCDVVDQARLNAGWSNERLAGSRTGVYVGHSCGSALGGEVVLGSMIPEVAESLGKIPEFLSLSESERSGILADFVARIQHQRPTRVANKPQLEANVAAQLVASRFKLDGPQMVIDAACASSMIALTLAAAALTQGEIDQAVVSSASYSKTDSLVLFSQARSCSATGSRPFDADADGLVSSEGYVVILVKTLSLARTDGDTIHGIIRGIGISSDGRGRSLWAPRKEGQFDAIQRAYSGALSRDSVQYIEAHATSTQVGDATELEALAAFFHDPLNKRKIPLGSVKSNIGHTLESAGLASLLKSVLCMQKGLIPPTIHLSNLNPAVNWDKQPFTVVQKTIPWPDIENQPRRSAVNAFGIGGLNAHVVIDGPPKPVETKVVRSVRPLTTFSRRNMSRTGYRPPDDSTSIAIIGRGLVVPGAFDVDSFRNLLKSGASQLVPPPPERWRDTQYSGSRPAIRRAFDAAIGGYIKGYTYDWRKHRIPPLQIENANPLQFMLLDAAQQALDDSGYGARPFDRSRSAVVVGTLFGGEFSHQLQVGLRIPEILDELSRALRSHKWSESQIQKICKSAEAQILMLYPAIKDQTGSFTSSTQASRVAKTLDIMGGAMAIDCGDCSSLAAIQSSYQILNAGIVDSVFCSAAQRDLDAAGFEAWSYRTFEPNDSIKQGVKEEVLAPGEGVVVLMLRRLKDALADRDQIHGVIREARATAFQHPMTIGSEEKLRSEIVPSDFKVVKRLPNSSTIARQFGYLQGASGLLEILGSTLSSDGESPVSSKSVIATNTETCEYQIVLEKYVSRAIPAATSLSDSREEIVPEVLEARKSLNNGEANGVSLAQQNAAMAVRSDGPLRSDAVSKVTVGSNPRIFRFWGVDEFELRKRLATAGIPSDTADDVVAPPSFPEHAPFRLAIVASDNEFHVKQKIAVDLLEQGSSPVRAQENGIYFCRPSACDKPRLAAMFPGQGSQRSGMLSGFIDASSSSLKILERADRSLGHFGVSPCSPWFLCGEAIPDHDLRSTQIAMLAANICAFHAAYDWGVRPDYLVGHSFGEYAALVSSGALDLESAIAITLARADAVACCAHSRGTMLSIAATFKEVQVLIANRSNLFISHSNAPRQTVVTGTSDSVADLAVTIKSLGIPAVQVPVDSPFHSPLLEGAQTSLKVALGQHRWRPPRIPLLSSVSGRFVGDRIDIIENLTRQLIEPLNWVFNIERLLGEDVRVFVEVGPGRVLSKLTQQIIGSRNAFAIPMDDPSVTVCERQLRIQAVMEAVGIPMQVPAPQPERAVPSFSRVAAAVVPIASITPETQKAVPRQNEIAIEESNKQGDPVSLNALAEGHSDASFSEPLAEFLIDVIVENTGYPRDVIELDWDLEADLGIDSIRKAMVLGELREYFDIMNDDDAGTFNQLRSIRDILKLLQKSSGKSDWLQASQAKPGKVPQVKDHFARTGQSKPVMFAQMSETAELHDNDSIQNSRAGIDDFLIDFVVEKTGYPRDVIELDADMESDLGIDSIAKAQLVGEIRVHFHLPAADASTRAALLQMRTLRQLREMVEDEVRVCASSDQSVAQKSIHNSSQINGHIDPLQIHRMTIQALPDFVPESSLAVQSSILSSRSHAHESTAESAFKRGLQWGRSHRSDLQKQLFDFADRGDFGGKIKSLTSLRKVAVSTIEDAEMRGVAEGANIHPLSLFSIREYLSFPLRDIEKTQRNDQASTAHQSVNGFVFPSAKNLETLSRTTLTQRYRLEMAPAEVRKWLGVMPEFSGGAIVIGDHPECEALVVRLESFGVAVSWLRDLGTRDEAVSALERIWQATPSPHLFILSPRDSQAVPTLDESRWKLRRESGITSLYWFCQKWMGLIEQAELFDSASLIGVTALGGDFGIAHGIVSAESGALTGLLKSIIIESWVNGHRTMPVKILDLPIDALSVTVVDAICVELCEPSYDVEIGWNRTSRSVLRSVPAPLVDCSADRLTPAGNWIVTGGARGITAFVVKQMSAKFPQVHFHLVGTAPEPALTPHQRELAKSDSAQLRAETMHIAKSDKRSPLKAWQSLEKEIEIDRSLSELAAAGIHATYYSCDVANRSQLSAVLDTIRQQSGPITGVIHGAGIGQDASFHRKESTMVERCLSAKLDGILNLMKLTQDDLLQAFIAFGSISGRFGANGHTDYSLANDMLAKLVCWHRQIRPTIPSAVFHWHAWDDIGMATKPETRLALDMIGMKLMPAEEGAAHFLREIEAGLPLTEVLITDTQYYRMFYPADRMLASTTQAAEPASGRSKWPLIIVADALEKEIASDEGVVCKARLDPVTDPFLTEHRLNDRPLLPMVIMAELLLEAASVSQDSRRPTGMRDLEIISSIKFPTDRPCDVRILSSKSSGHPIVTELRADFRSRNGTLVNANRLYAKAFVDFELSSADPSLLETLDREESQSLDWQPAQYPPAGSVFYVGGPLRCLRKYAIDMKNKRIWGRISAPSLSELAGAQRDVLQWLTPSAVIDAALFTSGILSWTCLRPSVSLPLGVKRITFHRNPRPAEVCWVRSQIVEVGQSEVVFDLTVWGSDGYPVSIIQSYVAAWLPDLN